MKQLISSGSPFEDVLGYSRAVVQGDWCFVSGITGYDYKAMKLADGLEAQVNACFTNLETVLKEAGFSMKDIVRVRHYVHPDVDNQDLAPMIGTHLKAVKPAAVLVKCELFEPAMLYEIEVTALRTSA